MKTRNGFVSNSSSSSFIIAFPHKPMSVDDLRLMVFGNADPDEMRYPPWDDDCKYGHTVQELSNQIFSDLTRRNPDSATVEIIADQMEGLYYWCNSTNCFSLGVDGALKNDYGWVFKDCSPFFATDKNSTDTLRDLEIEDEKLGERHRQAEREYINNILAKRGIKVPTSSDYYSEEYKKYHEAYQELSSKVYKTHMGFKKLHAKHIKESQAMWAQQKLLREKVSTSDAQAMVKRYPSHFIAHFEYGDSHGDSVPTGMGTVLEHGGIWERLPHVTINHH